MAARTVIGRFGDGSALLQQAQNGLSRTGERQNDP